MIKFLKGQIQIKKVKIFLSLCIVLSALSEAVPQDTGGSEEEDPAPGRSPGPPPISSEERNTRFLGEKKIKLNDSAWCTTHFSLMSSHYLNLSFQHSLFDLRDNQMLPGILYQVTVQAVQDKEIVDEIFVLTIMDNLPIGSWKNGSVTRSCPHGNWTKIDQEVKTAWIFHSAKPSNITFRFRYRLSSGRLAEEIRSYPGFRDCTLKLRNTKGNFSSFDLPTLNTCRIAFPKKNPDHSGEHKEGLLIEITRLNVPCAGGGFIQFLKDANDLNEVFNIPKKLCGKLEELNAIERNIYFPSLPDESRPFLLVHKNPVFSISYHLVDYCYNVTFVSQNGSLVLNPVKNLLCHFRIHLPYGYRVLLRLLMGEDKVISSTQIYEEKAQKLSSGIRRDSSFNYTSSNMLDLASMNALAWKERNNEECDGMSVIVWDGSSTWTHCSRNGDPKRDVQVWSQENIVMIKVAVRTNNPKTSGFPIVRFWYHAEPIAEIVGNCDFGEILVKQFCVSSVKIRLDWESAEKFCKVKGGHLTSIRDQSSKLAIDNLLLKGPNYREHDSYWIGATDKIYEGHFRWTDGFAFSYSSWFPGWSQQSYYNRQPNDDGFSHQDCVEVRRVFPHPSGSRIVDGITESYLWNDLDCDFKNFFLCERLESGEWSEQPWNQECNKTITLSREHPQGIVASPGFPHQYPDNLWCETFVFAPSGFRLIIVFEELVLEKEPSCMYDYLELLDYSQNGSFATRRLCGDMSDKLKLLRYISQGPKLKFIFVSDYSRHYGGFKARVSLESAKMECSDERYQLFNNSCYLFVGYPTVTWETGRQICSGMKAELASALSTEEENFITGNIRKSLEYTTSSIYWLGGFTHGSGKWLWVDGSPMEYSAWAVNQEAEFASKSKDNLCLAVEWVSLKNEKDQPTSGLYWTAQQCKKVGGYVCKKRNQISGSVLSLNKTINGTEGHITSPGYPNPYFHDLEYYIRFVGPIWTRMVVVFRKLDLEDQAECLYDYVELKSGESTEAEVRWCGNITKQKKTFQFVSNDNEAILKFHSDYSVAGIGFYADWKAVDVTGCPLQKLTAREGIITSPNYPGFLLPNLNCTTIILAPPGKRIWLEFSDSRLDNDLKQTNTNLEINLGGNHPPFKLFADESLLTGKNFISAAEKITVRLITSNHPQGLGYRAIYRTVSLVEEEEIVDLTPRTDGAVHHLNYPADPPPNVNFVQHFIAPMGYIIHLELYHVSNIEFGKVCSGGSGTIEIRDNYADVNGSWWYLCENKSNTLNLSPPLAIVSYLNTLHIRQKTASFGSRLNGTLKVKLDPNFKLKLLRAPEYGNVESCRPNPCQNGGKCLVTSEGKKICQCLSHFTGMFCALTMCELEPCLFGQCELTSSGYRCHCQKGYTGVNCERKQSPCEDNPCEGRGECMEKSDSFLCRCHAWWEGPKCEKRMVHIPFKPLSERMLQEPFWLGLITVFVVLAIIGIVWCAKRHFPEKLEKLLIEEADRHNKSNVTGIIRPPSVREQIHTSSGVVSLSSPPAASNNPRTLFGRLGIRKSSLLSLTSPQRPNAATSRTFSLDDLLRPPPRRAPSPRKNSINSVKKNPVEKKQILQQLMCTTKAQPLTTKVNLNELISFKEYKNKSESLENQVKETTFSDSAPKTELKTDLSKIEKKVTFARLLNKVSAEMSSGSEAETSNTALICSKALSTPVSPALERKSPLVGNQTSDSLSSSEIVVGGNVFDSTMDITNVTKRPSRLTYKGAKNASADSIFEMFRNFTTTSSLGKRTTPSTSPTPSSPREDRGLSDDSSPIDTPVSTTSGPIDSPTARGTTIEIPVMDALTAQKSSSSGFNFLQPPTILLEMPGGVLNKCLSPIREVPTPTPSPALTPVMARLKNNTAQVNAKITSEELIGSFKSNNENNHLSNIIIQDQKEFFQKKTLPSLSDLFPQAYSQETNDICPLSGMVIPLLTVQEPSPPSTSPPGSFPGSPPPYKHLDSFAISPENEFPRKLCKELDKPSSLDLSYPPPTITVTCNASEPESDVEPISPIAAKNPNLLNPNSSNVNGTTYLSPFSMCSRADRTASESNLSSSGYSSMTSPGPSRCGSNNPLCVLEGEDVQQAQSQPPLRRPSPLLRSSANDVLQNEETKHVRGRSDSETLSDDPLLESNDEGIGTDHLDEKVEEGEVKSARELELFMGKETNEQHFFDYSALIISNSSQRGMMKKFDAEDCSCNPLLSKASLHLPTIVVQSDVCDKMLSPVSSRSESPMSDKTLGFGRFSPMFYSKNKNDHLLFTDSDGLYDFPSSDCPISKNKSIQAGISSHRKTLIRRRERRGNRFNTLNGRPVSLIKGQSNFLEVSVKEPLRLNQRKPSPKRKIRSQKPLNFSSSSTESLDSAKFEVDWRSKREPVNEASVENSAEEKFKKCSNALKEDTLPKRKASAFRTIGRQIRCLRRVEISLKRKERFPYLNSDDEDIDRQSLSLLPKKISRCTSLETLQQSVATRQQENKKHNVLPLKTSLKENSLQISTNLID